ncbi:hypothetical protein RKE29_11435 [Streptomyces sp. B1866]|uniref:hypothetical protein n=1 Tax=Streptomyces sp. B1866 TaxID=3075431 RepID=UPI0028913379|nr:hypothetical protein [Streptomyces sp. B1866]MDT3397250.1 hypothetical protein [Streptomyces sp. B1866]
MGSLRRERGSGAVAAVAGGLVSVLLTAVAGCSSPTAADDHPADDSAPGAAAALHRAADVLARAGSSRVRTTVETASGGTRLSIRGTGAYDFAARQGRLRLVLPRDARGDEEHEPITELLVSGVLFMRNRGAGVPVDKWVRVDTAGIPDGNLVSGGATDPLAAAELLRGAREVRAVGRERLGGAVVWHYWGTADIGRAARAASPGVRGPLTAAATGFADGTVPFDAYLDSRGRLRAVRYRFAVANEWGGAGDGAPRTVSVVSTAELYDFGAEADVQLPAPADIYTGRVGAPRGRAAPDG